jgi:hypothetical protein
VITFELWRGSVDINLDKLGCSRALCDLPAGIDSALVTWFTFGVTAYIVAVCLSAVTMPGRTTLDADPLVPRESVAELVRQSDLWKARYSAGVSIDKTVKKD